MPLDLRRICGDCGAMVPEDQWRKHVAWHARLEARLPMHVHSFAPNDVLPVDMARGPVTPTTTYEVIR